MGISDCVDCDKKEAIIDCNCIPVENADGTLQDVVLGCTNVLAVNYNPLANCDDGSCILTNPGCMDPSALNYSTCFNADCDGNAPGSAAYIAGGTYGVDTCCCTTAGCMDPTADNYNAAACIDDGSCTYSGCTNFTACNYNPQATVDDGSCVYPTSASHTQSACTSYTWSISGQNYTASGTYTNVSTNPSGCPHTDTLNLTINQATTGTTNKTECITYTWIGALGNNNTYTTSGTYTSATTNANGCSHTETLNLTIQPPGCTDATAVNYDPAACVDDGSCTFPNPVPPVFKTNVSQGTCGANSVPPTFTGAVGGTYTYNGHYCDEDHTYDQLILTSEYSTDGGTTYTAGLPAGWALKKDLAGGALGNNQFQLTGPVAAGQTTFKLRVEDPGALFSEQLVVVSAAYQILQKLQFQIQYPNETVSPGSSRVPVTTIEKDLNIYTAATTVGGITISGVPLWNRTQIPTFTNAAQTVATGITASGGTYGGLVAGTEFNIYMKGLSPNVNSAPMEIGACLETNNNPGNIAVGQTIQFNSATLDAALPAFAPFTGTLEFTIIEEDIAHAPNSTVSIPLVGESKIGHGCYDGGFRLQVSCVNSAGETIYRKSRKINTSNVGTAKESWIGSEVGGYAPHSIRWAKATWVPPTNFDHGGTETWQRSSPNSTCIHTNDIDLTDGGVIGDSRYIETNNNAGYFIQGITPNSYSRTSGTFSLSDTIISDLSTLSATGIISAKLVGDEFMNANGTGARTTVATVDGNGAILTVNTLTAAGSGYSWPSTGTRYSMKTITGSGTGAFIRGNLTTGVFTTIGAVHVGGANYSIGDEIEFDGDNTWVANAHGDACVMRVFREDPSNPGQHIEIGIGTNGLAIEVGSGSVVEIDLFNNTVTVV